MKRILYTLAFLLSITICKSQEYSYIGEKFSTDNVIAVDEAIQQNFDEEIVIKGTVDAVCQVKGCWMTLKGADSKNEIFVKFKDYAFFMPFDLQGDAVVKGILSKNVTSVEELRHYAEDKGQSKEEIMAIDKPKEEFHFMASGVLISQ
jgi:hypothetical protein